VAVGALSAPASAGAETLLAEGSAGPAVSKVQGALHVRRTGRFGRATRVAVIAFQRRDRLMVDGIVGPQTSDALFGVAPAPASTAASASGGSAPTSPSGVSSSGSAGYSIPSNIVQCESGGNYSAVNSSTGAGGAYQILPSTWQAYGGQGLPQDAPAAEQDRIAAEVYAHQGASAWSC
jgi:peptidoglycan hydrolase-like protein with peptidoglycan-binding domain